MPIGQEIVRFKVSDRDATEANREPFTSELVDFHRRDSAFGLTVNGSLSLTKRPLRNITHFLKPTTNSTRIGLSHLRIEHKTFETNPNIHLQLFSRSVKSLRLSILNMLALFVDSWTH